ncbi:MAG: NAD(P)-dependent oxidoreductase [Alphaproteobacteria bacterium]|nr:NAD(P)-dependent oxidoreductase [Alphaproteobacteria bacterium]
MTGQTYGFVGLGQMGGPMSKRLLEAGHALCVFDTDPAAMQTLTGLGAVSAGTARDVADAAEIVFTSLPTPAVVRAVALEEGGLIEGARIRTMVDLSTTGTVVACEVAARLAGKDIVWADAPVSGGVKGAVAGTLAVMLSCPQATRDGIAGLLEVFGKVFFVGENPGQGQIAKLGNNMLSTAALTLTSEVVAMGVKAGLDPKVMVDIFNAGTGRNSATQDKFPRNILPRTFDAGFATGLAYKDVRLCVDEAEALGVPMVAGAVIREMMAITNAKFGGDSDFTSVAKLLEEWAGVEIRG